MVTKFDKLLESQENLTWFTSFGNAKNVMQTNIQRAYDRDWHQLKNMTDVLINLVEHPNNEDKVAERLVLAE